LKDVTCRSTMHKNTNNKIVMSGILKKKRRMGILRPGVDFVAPCNNVCECTGFDLRIPGKHFYSWAPICGFCSAPLKYIHLRS
jgi:hypothetical protein